MALADACLAFDLQIVVLDKLDYCASIRNLESVIDQPNVKVGLA
jgi:dTDP-D-glucose 4,6-dehydratase